MLTCGAGLFIGFTFYNSKDSLQSTQNKLFVCFCSFFSREREKSNLLYLGTVYGHDPQRTPWSTSDGAFHHRTQKRVRNQGASQ